MNRRQKRAAQAKAKSATVDPVVAVHEAGHALARYLTAEMMGLSKEQSVHSIVVHVPQDMPKSTSLDGKMLTAAQAITMGPIFSNEIAAVSNAMDRENGWSDLPTEELTEKWNSLETRRELMERAREQGCDIEKWVRARAIIAVGGALAEAAYRKVSWTEVWEGYEAENDMTGLIRDISTLGLPDDESESAFDDAVDDAATWFYEKMVGTPGVLDAINVLTTRIVRKHGTIPGRTVVGIIQRTMEAARAEAV